MSTRPVTFVIASLLSIALIVPAAFLAIPQRAYAQYEQAVPAVPTQGLGFTDFKTAFETTITAIESTLSEALLVTDSAANYAQKINAYVLQPLAFVLSGNLMKALTASVIAFVIGKANGTGVPQFVVDVRKSMQTVSDGQALAYLNQIGQTNSPFSASIASSLRNNYLQNTSLAGFWKANLCTLSRTSPNNGAGFLAGRWQQGGVAAWFALTTQVQNNPYTLYQNSRDKMGSLIGPGVGGATGARTQELAWGSGFMSWCGSSDSATQAANASASAAQGMAAMAPSPVVCTSSTNSFRDAQGDCYASAADAAAADATNNASEQLGNVGAGRTATGGIGVNPGDPCNKADGTPGTIMTPGTTIKATLDKVLGGQQDQIVRMGNVGGQINQILGNVATVLQTVQFASQILGGPGSGGLFGVGQTSGSNSTSRLAQFAPTQDPTTGSFTSGYLNTNNASINAVGAAFDAEAAANAATGASKAAAAAVGGGTSDGLATRAANYESAWITIAAAANAASASVTSLANFCTAAAGVTPSSGFEITSAAQAAAARTALASEIVPVLAQAAAASTTVAAARVAMQNTASSTTASVQISQMTMSPTMSDVVFAQTNASASGVSTANPSGSLTVSGGSLVSQMNLISANATALKTSVCTPPPPEFFGL